MSRLKAVITTMAVISFFTGCQNPLSALKSSSTSSNTKQSPAPKKTNSVATAGNANLSSSVSIVIQNTPGTPVKSSKVIQNGNTIYYVNWSDDNKIYSISVGGTGKKKISDDSAYELLLSNNTIYYNNELDSDKLYAMNTDGTNRKKLLDEKALNLELLNNFIYYIGSDNNLSTFNTSNNSKTSLKIITRSYDTDGNSIYYENYSNKHVLNIMNVDGSNSSKLSDDAPMDIVSQTGTIYYVNGWDHNKIYKIVSDGTGRSQLNDVSSSSMVLDSGYIYYINNSDYDSIYKIKVDGSGNIKLGNDNFINFFAVAGTYVYYAKKTDTIPQIYKISK
ncbi:DUF5050 domain-containing protein [Clostridiaceae bacterium UIB06]|uniref:DUF5050 domain-containing protein n=1 Tax=Clostridium thailandense TaxID=2794346 RepID=A0A949X2T4_9CLOT|nr:DUF5050 domain-containing protein [Clostridium thailandense]MBV7271668.1 DUF5050 domain-containing protein [Clostridium thailandense]MCH5136361.1 DUF5050 domain-containing protein [Clostridiaceae bacterium UIB06]